MGKITAKQFLLNELVSSLIPLAIHEIKTTKWNQNNLSTRVSELCRAGIIEGKTRKGKCYKEWWIKPSKP